MSSLCSIQSSGTIRGPCTFCACASLCWLSGVRAFKICWRKTRQQGLFVAVFFSNTWCIGRFCIGSYQRGSERSRNKISKKEKGWCFVDSRSALSYPCKWFAGFSLRDPIGRRQPGLGVICVQFNKFWLLTFDFRLGERCHVSVDWVVLWTDFKLLVVCYLFWRWIQLLSSPSSQWKQV